MKRGVALRYSSFRRSLYLAVGIATATCTEPLTEVEPPEDPGFVRVSVTGPLNPAVAFKLRLMGEGLDSARVNGGTLFFQTLGPTQHRAIVIGAPDRTRLLEFWIPDRNVVDAWTAAIEEVAATGTYQQQPVTGYVAMVGR